MADCMVLSVVVMLESVPLTPNGKIDRHALHEPFISIGRTPNSEPPCPSIEQRMVQIWSEYWQAESIGANNNFFELGAHSLLALRVAVEPKMGRHMDLRSPLRQVSAHVASAPGSARWSAQ